MMMIICFLLVLYLWPHFANMYKVKCYCDVLNVFIDIQTSKELIQMDTDKMMTYGTFTMDDEKLTQS